MVQVTGFKTSHDAFQGSLQVCVGDDDDDGRRDDGRVAHFDDVDDDVVSQVEEASNDGSSLAVIAIFFPGGPLQSGKVPVVAVSKKSSSRKMKRLKTILTKYICIKITCFDLNNFIFAFIECASLASKCWSLVV